MIERTVPSRVRIRYTKTGRIRYTSQRDIARAFERTLRRAQLPIAYSEGFSPHPLLAFSLALPTGCESRAEYADLRFSAASEVPGGWQVVEEPSEADLQGIVAEFSRLMPEGVEMVSACILDGSEGSLQEEVTSCHWIVEVTGMATAQLEERVENLLSAAEVPIQRERKGRMVSDDLRPGVLSLELVGPGASPGALRLHTELATKPRGVRPSELLRGLDSNLALARASRQAQWITRDGQRLEPLTADGELLGQATAPVGGR
jgi:radical SAM-linked protein